MTPNERHSLPLTNGHLHDVDFDLGGILRVRLLAAGRQDVTAVARYLGRPQAVAVSPADITVRFTDRLPAAGLTYLGRNQLAFDGDDLTILGRRTGRPKARIPLANIGQQPEIVCQRGIGDVPFLLDIVNVTFTLHDYVALHASAFLHDGRGILVTGWTKGGKTETLLAFADRGAVYVGDEWIVLSRDGLCLFGLPVPVTLWAWQLPHLRRLKPSVSAGRRRQFAAVRRLTALHRHLERTRLRRTAAFRLLDKALPTLQSQSKIRLAPEQLFPGANPGGAAPFDALVLALSHADPATTVTPATATDIAARMVHSNAVERAAFSDALHAWRFAVTDHDNPFLEQVPAREAALLTAALADKPAFTLRHPYPVPLATLFEALAPALASGGRRG